MCIRLCQCPACLPKAHPRDLTLQRRFLTQWWPFLQAPVSLFEGFLWLLVPQEQLQLMRGCSWWIKPLTSCPLDNSEVCPTLCLKGHRGIVPQLPKLLTYSLTFFHWLSLFPVSFPHSLPHHASLDNMPPKLFAFKSLTWVLFWGDATVRHYVINIKWYGRIHT